MSGTSGAPGNGSQWHWNGDQWLWWDGSAWQEAGVGEQVGQGSSAGGDQGLAGGAQAGVSPPAAPTEPEALAATSVGPVAPEPAAAATATAAPSTAPVAVVEQPVETPTAAQAGSVPQKRGLGTGGILAIVFGALLGALLIGGLIALLVSAIGGDDDVVTLQTEPLSTSVSAFTPPMGTDTAVASPARATGLQNVPAETVGLFGGTLNNASCDKAQLVAYLQANPDKAGPWAQTLGITPDQIPAFVAPLTPVLLRSDTVVTNHGFENGRITTMPAVLQAGTAVLVNEFGQPVVKCYCGNPLTAAPTQLSQVKYTGPTWPGFQPGAVTIVQPATTAITSYTLVDVTTNQTFVRAAGTDGSADTASATPAPQSLTPTTPAPQPTAAPTSPPPVTEAGREDQAIETLKNTYRACAAAQGDTEGVEEILAAASYSVAPTGAARGEYSVTATDESGTFEHIVNVDTGSVRAVNDGALQVAQACPGVFD